MNATDLERAKVHEADACLVLANKVIQYRLKIEELLTNYIVDALCIAMCKIQFILLTCPVLPGPRRGGRCQHHAGDLHEELLCGEQDHHPAHAVPQQGQMQGHSGDHQT